MRRLAPVVMAAILVGAFLWLHPKAVRHSAGPYQLNRELAHRNAVAGVKAMLGEDVSQWKWKAKADLRTYLFLWQKENARQPLDFLTTPVETDLLFQDQSSRDEVTVTLTSSGKVMGLKQSRKSSKKGEETRSTAGNAATAKALFAQLAGGFADHFKEENTSSSSEFRWSAATASSAAVHWDVMVKFDSDRLREATLRPRIEESQRNLYNHAVRGSGDAAEIAWRVLVFSFGVVAVILFTLGSIRKMMERRSALTAGALFLVTALISYAMGAEVSKSGSGFRVNVVFGPVALAAAFLCVTGAGMGAARQMEWSRWRALRLFLQRKWTAKDVGASIANGLLWSGLLALIPVAVVASGAYPRTFLDPSRRVMELLAPYPAFAALHPPVDILSAGLFALILPLLSQRVGIRWLTGALFFPLASAIAYAGLGFATGPFGAAQAACLYVLAASLLYWRYDLLTVVAAGKGAAVLTLAAELLQNGATASAMGVLCGLSLVLAAGMMVGHSGNEVEPVDPVAGRYLSQRERLKAEFSLAQQAQQRMLPEVPPRLDGFTVAASCQPARDVGGDLYDYFQLPDGRKGFCVADVSGKGMPAALYMTLTKGLIAAASPESGDLLDLARSMNRHLHAACKRKVFVTAILASLDAERGEVEMIRAGHNPALWYESDKGMARYLNPPGIGLGMTGALLFDRGTKLDSITLAPGDTLILYSDGVTEAMNERLELYGEERLKMAVERFANGDATSILSGIKNDLVEFTGAEPAHDDVTLLVLQARRS